LLVDSDAVDRIVAQLWYEQGRIEISLPFPELKKRSDITEKAKAAKDAPDFSVMLCEGLPGQDHGWLV
jgi:hypothetical protein